MKKKKKKEIGTKRHYIVKFPKAFLIGHRKLGFQVQ